MLSMTASRSGPRSLRRPTLARVISGALTRPPTAPGRTLFPAPPGEASRWSEAQLAQLARVALPVLGDLDLEVEVDGRAEEGLDLLAGGRADGAQAGALVADHDPLLGVALDVEVGHDHQQRLVVGASLAQPHLLDHDGDRVRQLVAHALKRGLTDEAGGERPLGRV